MIKFILSIFLLIALNGCNPSEVINDNQNLKANNNINSNSSTSNSNLNNSNLNQNTNSGNSDSIDFSQNNTNNSVINKHYLGAKILDAQTKSTLPKATIPPSDGGNLPQIIDLSPNMPPVRNQGGQGSCVSWAVGYYLKSYQEHIEKYTNYTDKTLFSPSFLYNIVKAGDCNAGSYIHKNLERVQNIGIASLSTMPYKSTNCSGLPSQQANQEAKCNKILSYKILPLSTPMTDNDLISIKYFISQKKPIVIAIPVYEGFDNPSYTNGEYIYNTYSTNKLRGYHAILIVGYDDTRGAIKIVNSWGDTWKNNGYLWITYNVAKQIILDAYISTDAKNLCSKGGASMQISSSTLNFINQTIGVKSTKQITITNTGTQDLTISDISIPTYFSTNLNAPITIKPYSNITMDIVYNSTDIGQHNGKIVINSNADNGVANINIIANSINKSVTNQKPVAKISQSNMTKYVGDTITLDGYNSSDDKGIVKYEWLDNGNRIGTNSLISTSSLTQGTHTITLKLTDIEGLTGSATITITIQNRPTPATRIISFNNVSPSIGRQTVMSVSVGTTFNYQLSLSTPLKANEQVALNFDDLNSGWFNSNVVGGKILMNCVNTTCSLNRVLYASGDRKVRATIYRNNSIVGYTQYKNIVVIPSSITNTSITPSSGGIAAITNFNFNVTLSGNIPNGYDVYLNFDNLAGNWFNVSDAGGHIAMNCINNRNTCSLTKKINQAGNRFLRTGIFKTGSNQLEGSYGTAKSVNVR